MSPSPEKLAVFRQTDAIVPLNLLAAENGQGSHILSNRGHGIVRRTILDAIHATEAGLWGSPWPIDLLVIGPEEAAAGFKDVPGFTPDETFLNELCRTGRVRSTRVIRFSALRTENSLCGGNLLVFIGQPRDEHAQAVQRAICAEWSAWRFPHQFLVLFAAGRAVPAHLGDPWAEPSTADGRPKNEVQLDLQKFLVGLLELAPLSRQIADAVLSAIGTLQTDAPLPAYMQRLLEDASFGRSAAEVLGDASGRRLVRRVAEEAGATSQQVKLKRGRGGPARVWHLREAALASWCEEFEIDSLPRWADQWAKAWLRRFGTRHVAGISEARMKALRDVVGVCDSCATAAAAAGDSAGAAMAKHLARVFTATMRADA